MKRKRELRDVRVSSRITPSLSEDIKVFMDNNPDYTESGVIYAALIKFLRPI